MLASPAWPAPPLMQRGWQRQGHLGQLFMPCWFILYRQQLWHACEPCMQQSRRAAVSAGVTVTGSRWPYTVCALLLYQPDNPSIDSFAKMSGAANVSVALAFNLPITC